MKVGKHQTRELRCDGVTHKFLKADPLGRGQSKIVTEQCPDADTTRDLFAERELLTVGGGEKAVIEHLQGEISKAILGSAEPSVQQMAKETEKILDEFERTHGTRISLARALAVELARADGGVKGITVADVHERWNLRYGAETWTDTAGSSYWAGAIFRGKQWEKLGTVSSKFNHNFSGNGLWKLKGGE